MLKIRDYSGWCVTAVDYTLKAGNRRDISRLGVLVPVKENKSGLLFSNIFGLYDSLDAVESYDH